MSKSIFLVLANCQHHSLRLKLKTKQPYIANSLPFDAACREHSNFYQLYKSELKLMSYVQINIFGSRKLPTPKSWATKKTKQP